MNEVKLTAYKVEGFAVTVDVPENREYFEALTAIFNNVRTSSYLYKVSNRAGNNHITVICDEQVIYICKEWLGNFGEIVNEKPTTVFLLDSEEPFLEEMVSFDERYEICVK
ncbi:MAG: hypothetical protein ACI4IK_01435 [Eubacterium sp.]